MKTKKNLAIAIFALLVSVASFAQKPKNTVDPKMDATKNIVENLATSQDFSSIGKVFTAAEFDELLREEGPYTILAPSNEAFNRNSETLDYLLDSKNILHTKNVAAYHIIYGKWYATDFGKLIRAGKGKGEIKTSNGEVLTITLENGAFYFADSRGNKSKVLFSDAIQTNGIIHGIDRVFTTK